MKKVFNEKSLRKPVSKKLVAADVTEFVINFKTTLKLCQFLFFCKNIIVLFICIFYITVLLATRTFYKILINFKNYYRICNLILNS